MISLLKSHIEKTIQRNLTNDEFNQFTSLIVEKQYDKKAFLAEEGKVCSHMYFIEKGSCYSYILDETGNKHVMQFALEGYFISDLYSFFSGKKAIYYIETLEATQVLALSKEHFQKACQEIPIFETYFRVLIQNAYVSMQYRLAKTNSAEAETRYLELAQTQPDLLLRIPQYLIASYLGIKPQSLSRIRKDLVNKK